MKIEIKNLNTFYINLNSAEARREHTENMLGYLGIKNYKRIPGVESDPYLPGLAQAHYNALSAGQGNTFLVLEDDARPFLYKQELNVPDNTDAIFLGISMWGGSDDTGLGIKDGLVFESVPGYPHLVRVKNALSAHAIVYVSDRYVESVKSAALECVAKKDLPFDSAFSLLHKDYYIYAVREPFFYQHDIEKIINLKGTSVKILDDIGVVEV